MNDSRAMTNKMITSVPRTPQITAPELDEAIIAKPLVTPDFVDIRPKNPNVSFRWVEFKAQDGMRLSQAQAQGWQTATQLDIADGSLSPFRRDNGSKFINGDLILMKMDRGRYLGAKKYKHQVAAALADPSVLKTVTAQSTSKTLAQAGAAEVNKQKDAFGNPKMTVFTPGAADLSKTPLGTADGAAELARLGSSGPPDVGGKGV